MAVRRHIHYMRWLYIVFHKKFLFCFCFFYLFILVLFFLDTGFVPLDFVLPPELGFRRHVCKFGSDWSCFNWGWLWFWFDGCRVFESLSHCHGLCWWFLWRLKRFLVGLFGLLGLFLGQCAKCIALWVVDMTMSWLFFGLLFVLGLLFFGLRFQWREVVIFGFGFEHGGHEFQFGFCSDHWIWTGKHDGWLSAVLIALIALIGLVGSVIVLAFRLVTVSARVSGLAAVQAGLNQ